MYTHILHIKYQHIYTIIQKYLDKYICDTYLHICICIFIYIYTYIHIYICTYMYICTYIHFVETAASLVRFARWWRRGSMGGAKRIVFWRNAMGNFEHFCYFSAKSLNSQSFSYMFRKIPDGWCVLSFVLCPFPLQLQMIWMYFSHVPFAVTQVRSEGFNFEARPSWTSIRTNSRSQNSGRSSYLVFTSWSTNCICKIPSSTNWHVIMTLHLAYYSYLTRSLTLSVTCIPCDKNADMVSDYLSEIHSDRLDMYSHTLPDTYGGYNLFDIFLGRLLTYVWTCCLICYLIWYDMIYQYLRTV